MKNVQKLCLLRNVLQRVKQTCSGTILKILYLLLQVHLLIKGNVDGREFFLK